MITVHLVLLVIVVAAGSRLLPRAEWVYRSPRLGLAAWCVVLVVVGLSAAGAALALLLPLPAAWHRLCAWWEWCTHQLGQGWGTEARTAGWVAVGLLTAFATSAAVRLVGWIRDGRRRHRERLRLLCRSGRWDARLGVLVVDDPRPAAYVLPGRAGTIVVTSGALQQLPPPQLAAVLAHERAHVTGRHHLLAQGTRLLSRAFPAVPALKIAEDQIHRLVEIRADEVAAANGHARLDLARALVTCAEGSAVAAPGAGPIVPAGAVSAAGADALERVRRLLSPPNPLDARTRIMVSAGLLVLAAAPVLVLAGSGLFPALGVGACLSVI
ncbi:MAG TPA: M56 family metallopeptidase [Micromonosporaceae bacterium]|nr:M56 family metallopeptidase [Micromonosporaceae bacterium]